METVRIDILNPKVKTLLENLAELKLIKINKYDIASEFKKILNELRTKDENPVSLEEITEEVEKVRKTRYEK